METVQTKRKIGMAPLAVAIMVLSLSPTIALADTVSFGVVPQQSATRLAKNWTPFLKSISEKAGIKVSFATTKDIPSFEACLSKGAYDFAYMNPYHYTVFHDQSGYQAFARQKDKRLRGLLVVRKESAISSLQDLDGASIAFPSPAAFGASVIPRAELAARGVSFKPRYVKSHDSVYRAVSAGHQPAGGGVLRTFNTVPADIRDQLHIVYRTEGYTPHAFAHREDVSSGTLETVKAAMLEIESTQPDLLRPLGMVGLQAAMDADWNDIRNLGLKREQTEIVETGTLKCRSD
ncbi:MAG: phosphate/phosphite/phosphonate ABC transporter substrate-binding protein [Pseudomonadota bacterium]